MTARTARAAFDILMNADVPAAAADLDAAFKGGVLSLELSTFLHARGINMRYLPEVAARCRNVAARQFLEQEAVVRAAKHKIRALWAERAESDAHAAAIAADVIQRLRRGELWDQLSQPAAPQWSWEARLRDALGIQAARVSDKHEHRLLMARAPGHTCDEVCLRGARMPRASVLADLTRRPCRHSVALPFPTQTWRGVTTAISTCARTALGTARR
jgi:hypothetical protein